ncbi:MULTISPECIES: NirD/YgiW/YdeI family stress tolerance protein [unclassified Anaerobiospirillum]|uniref:NirD/YgiW/YdeI family stress tolerance protein n=1 Tax=unclassified Anaerobiospirillum TaxID=2647410 RepID=UPI001FF67831|nr:MULTISPECIES: NirD/YgiW/YdeI family stress tolerance protein [unclassified Anaerobiospirillum]MCK0534990.1 NirD/YgiW/YdeI family stress tolerance protein [Anaerobiospirillum sp. NML120511]MCK0540212.1 NirD/YgiW/YdeI family stress tolerance protein [Anaerobiospirillum sp. NML02-A-032]
MLNVKNIFPGTMHFALSRAMTGSAAVVLSTSLLLAPACVWAGYKYHNAPQGFSDQLNSVAVIQTHGRDDEVVRLRGRLTGFLHKNNYEFTDEQGSSIEVELDDDVDWSYVHKDQLIEIIGEVERNMFKLKIEAKSYRIIETTAATAATQSAASGESGIIITPVPVPSMTGQGIQPVTEVAAAVVPAAVVPAVTASAVAGTAAATVHAVQDGTYKNIQAGQAKTNQATGGQTQPPAALSADAPAKDPQQKSADEQGENSDKAENSDGGGPAVAPQGADQISNAAAEAVKSIKDSHKDIEKSAREINDGAAAIRDSASVYLVSASEDLTASASDTFDSVKSAVKSVGSEVAQSASEAGKEAAEISRQIGKEAVEAGRQIGKEAAEAGREAGREASEAGRALGKEAAEAGRAISAGAERMAGDAAAAIRAASSAIATKVKDTVSAPSVTSVSNDAGVNIPAASSQEGSSRL